MYEGLISFQAAGSEYVVARIDIGKKSAQKSASSKKWRKILSSFLPGGKNFKDKVGILKLMSTDK